MEQEKRPLQAGTMKGTKKHTIVSTRMGHSLREVMGLEAKTAKRHQCGKNTGHNSISSATLFKASNFFDETRMMSLKKL